MQCPACRHSSPDGARFCSACGAPLSDAGARCPACAAQLISGARFCHECGGAAPDAPSAQPAPPSPAPPPISLQDEVVGEKRLATVLFADMMASVEVTRDLHPEDALALVKELLRAMADAIIANGGKVDRFLGDGALGVFGFSQTKESDAERAVLAALQIRDAARRLGIQVRVGINTGEVYAGGVGSIEYHETTVMGSVVSFASRLQALANPGEILVGHTTYRLVRRLFHCERRTLNVKGLDGARLAYAVERLPLRSQTPLADPEGPTADPNGTLAAGHGEWQQWLSDEPEAEALRGPGPLTGRDEELALLRAAAFDAASGQGRGISLVGNPGLGKSRLLSELRREIAGRRLLPGGRRVLWLEGRCSEFAEAVAYWPFVGILREWLGWRPEDDDAVRRDRLAEGLAQLVELKLLPPDVAQDLSGPIGALLSIPQEPASTAPAEHQVPPRHVTFAAVRRFVMALAAARPLVLALEDLHWADSLSVELLSYVMEAAPRSSLLIVCTYRPDQGSYCRQLEAVARARCGAAYQRLGLDELDAAESCRLGAALLKTEKLPSAVEGSLLRTCQGNPLFIEETLRSMVETGVIRRGATGWEVYRNPEDLRTTETIQSLILSRVDRLPSRLKLVLQLASVLGTWFRPRLLPELGLAEDQLQSDLLQLQEAGFLQPQGAEAGERDDPVLAFHHALTRETIYGTILRRRRQELHLQVAVAIEQRYGSVLEDHFEELARHYSESRDPLKAAEYLVRSGERAYRLYANHEAASYSQRALQSLAQLPREHGAREWETRALETLGDVLFRAGSHQQAEQRFLAARAQVDGATDPLRFATLSWKLADSLHWQGHMARAVTAAEEGLQVLDGRATPEAVRLLEVIMRSQWAVDDLVGARETGNQLEAALPHVPYFASLYMIYYALAWLEIKWERFDRARHWLEEMGAVCREQHDEIGLARCYHGLGDLARATRDYHEAADWFAKSVALCERTGDAHLLLEGYLEWAQVLLLNGADEDAAEPHITRGMALAEEMAATGGVSSIQALCAALGRAFTARGDLPRAIQFFERAFEFGPHPSPEVTLRELGNLYARTGCPERLPQLCQSLGYAVPAD